VFAILRACISLLLLICNLFALQKSKGDVVGKRGKIIKASMFPPTDAELAETEVDSETGKEVSVLPLERCWRLVPHHQDTGG
jgi:hypothetical protein